MINELVGRSGYAHGEGSENQRLRCAVIGSCPTRLKIKKRHGPASALTPNQEVRKPDHQVSLRAAGFLLPPLDIFAIPLPLCLSLSPVLFIHSP
ncbi:hypothetical protein GW17_00016181 [Ensete ventricosum]|nr:hypothetical protein GW17_00016181 [Ensete ventricosum]RZR89680.1 hypothetical protein BHM03_00017440 [Ensete ventricosum]